MDPKEYIMQGLSRQSFNRLVIFAVVAVSFAGILIYIIDKAYQNEAILEVRQSERGLYNPNL